MVAVIPTRSFDALTITAGLGVLGGVATAELAPIVGSFLTVTIALLAVAIAVAAGMWLLPSAETTVSLWRERELLEDGGRQ